MQSAVGRWWTAADERNGASVRSSLGGWGVIRLQLGTDVERVSTAMGSRCGLEYKPLRVLLSSQLSSVSVSIMVTMVN